MAWVLSAVLVVALILVAAILGRQLTTVRRQLTAALDLNSAAPETPAVPEPAAPEPAAPERAGQPIVAETPGLATAVDTPEAAAVDTPGAEVATWPGDPSVVEEPSGAVDPSATEATRPAGSPADEAMAPEVPTAAEEGAHLSASPEPAPASLNVPIDGRLPSLWALTLLEQQRQWQLSVGSAASATETTPESLPAVLAVEVERIREEVGTPGSLDFDMTPPAMADDDAIIFHATRQLLALLVPHTQAFDLVLHRVDDQAVLQLTCSGWEGPGHVAEGVGRLLEAVAPAGGDLELAMLPGDRLQAILRLPLH